MNTPEEKLSLIASAFAVVDDVTADGNRAANARQTIRDVLAGVEVDTMTIDEHEREQRVWAARLADAAATLTSMHDTIAKLTADNAALRAAVDACVTASHNVNDSFDVAFANLVRLARRKDPGAGWVSPEEHAAACNASGNAHAKMITMRIERDAARARAEKAEAIVAESRRRMLDNVDGKGGTTLITTADLDALRAELGRVKAEAEGLRAILWEGEFLVDFAEYLGRDLDPTRVVVEKFREYAAKHRAALASPTPAQGAPVPPVCPDCNDTHTFPGSGHMCTSCPVPCQACRVSATGAFCTTTPCACKCHEGQWRYKDWFARKANALLATPAQGDDISATSVMLKGGAP